MEKTCSVCKFTKERGLFPARGAQCKRCIADKAKAWYEANPDRARASRKAWHEANKSENLARCRAYRQANLEAARARERDYGRRNAEAKRASSLKWNSANPERLRARVKEWQIANPDMRAAQQAKYKASKLRGTPPWVKSEDFRPIYAERIRVSIETGIAHHVDHIVPLQGELVSGLHVPWNLQVIPAMDNIKKHNRFVDDASLQQAHFRPSGD